MSLFDVLNHELGGDPVHVRVAVTMIVALAAFQWPRDMRRHWSDWTRRGRRVTMAMLPVIVANALLLLAAAQRQDPIRVSVAVLAATFVVLNIALLIRFDNDATTERQYGRVIDRISPWRRFFRV